MKCRIKSSGEIVDVIGWSFDGSWTHYVDINGIDTTDGLDYYKNFEPIVEDNIDWEQRRYEISKAYLTGYCSGESFYSGKDDPLGDCKRAIEYADELIRQLKQ